MDREEAIAKVVEAVTLVQESSGRSMRHIGSNTRPVSDLDDFDSLNGVEATVILSESLGYDIPDNYNPFVSEDGRRALSVGEIADNICSLAGAEVKAKE